MSDFQLGPGPLMPEFEQVKSDIGIVENGDTATHAIPKGYYVIWKGDLYVAKSDISSGTTLSSSNLTAKTSGIGADLAALNSKLATSAFTVYNCTSTIGAAYVYVNPFAKIAICKFNAGNNTGNGTITPPEIAKPAAELFAALRGSGYISSTPANGTIHIESAIAWDAGQLVYPIV